MVHQMKFSDEFYEFQELLSNMTHNLLSLHSVEDHELDEFFDMEKLRSNYDESVRLVKKKFADVLEIALKAQQ